MQQIILNGIENVQALLKDRKFLLVKDQAYPYLGVDSYFNDHFHVDFSKFTSNPLYEQVVEGVDVFKQSHCDMIVAIGGGSAIDVAKCIKLFCSMDPNSNFLKQTPTASLVPLVAIPTTAGTGSESTQHAVIYYNGEKQSIASPSIIPDYAILEPKFLISLPEYQKKSTMLDALCQGIESWWSISSTEQSKYFAKKAVYGIVRNAHAYLEGDLRAADLMIKASNYAGRAINITATTAAHAMSYKITAKYSFAHGHAVAICLPEVWLYLLRHTNECTDRRGEKYLRETLYDIAAIIDVKQFQGLLEELNVEYPCTTNKSLDIEELVNAVNVTRLKNTPVALHEDTLREMYGRIIKECRSKVL